MVTVIFPAAGQGRRMGAGKNKVFLDLAGKPILLHTLLAFSKNKRVNEFIVVVAAEEVAEIVSLLGQTEGLKPWRVVAGGSQRQYSIANGLAVLTKESDIVLVHDAARPFVSTSLIDAVIDEVQKNGAAVAAVPEKNTIKIVNENRTVVATPDRETLWSIQTPQGFTRDIVLASYAQAAEEGFLGTDDASLVERTGVAIKVVLSDYRNIKITTPEDLIVAEAFFQEKQEEKEK